MIDVEEVRDAQTVVNFSYKLEEKGGSCSKIKTFISDMSSAYKSTKEECFCQSAQVIDKFHVKQEMLKAIDEVRKEEQGRKTSSGREFGKKLLMIPESRQTEQQKEKVAELSRKYSKTGRAFRMVQAIDEMYRCDKPEEAKNVFNKLISWLRQSRLAPMKRVAQTLKAHQESIL